MEEASEFYLPQKYVENLELLIDLLESQILPLGFTMDYFMARGPIGRTRIAVSDVFIDRLEDLKNGTIGDPLAQAVRSDIPELQAIEDDVPYPPAAFKFWCNYSERVFGLECDTMPWDWCFAQDWRRTDNTPEGAAARIQYLLDFGMPVNTYEQMNGKERLCYTHLIVPPSSVIIACRWCKEKLPSDQLVRTESGTLLCETCNNKRGK